MVESAAFVPPDFVAPSSLVTPLFLLEPLGPQHNEADYAAWTSSLEHIRRTPGWPDIFVTLAKKRLRFAMAF